MQKSIKKFGKMCKTSLKKLEKCVSLYLITEKDGDQIGTTGDAETARLEIQ